MKSDKCKALLLAIGLWPATFSLVAQTGTIQGKILDAQTDESLIGVSVLVEGTGTGAATDFDGRFSMEVTANVVTLAGEGVVLAVCKRFNRIFGNMKIAFDVTLVVLSCILSLMFLHGLYGVREGTVAAALCVGIVARFFNSLFKKIHIDKIL